MNQMSSFGKFIGFHNFSFFIYGIKWTINSMQLEGKKQGSFTVNHIIKMID